MLTLYGVNIIPGRDQNRPGTCEMDGLWRAMRVRDAITYAIYGKCESNDSLLHLYYSHQSLFQLSEISNHLTSTIQFIFQFN